MTNELYPAFRPHHPVDWSSPVKFVQSPFPYFGVSGHFHFTSRSLHRLTSGWRVLKTVKIGRPVTRVTESPESPESPGVTKSTNERSRRSGGHEKKTAENDENKPKLLPKLAGKFKSIQMRKKTCRHILSVDPGFKPWI